MKTVELIASGYEWTCPECDKLNHEIEVTVTVKCKCGQSYSTMPPEHCYGS